MTQILDSLNPAQREAVITEENRVLVIAGAGSGKTRTLTHRVAWAIANGIEPSQILAVTFTNKAANEMRNRISHMIGSNADECWIGTFHSICVRILIRHGKQIGVRSGFSILDERDQLKLMKQAMKDVGADGDYKAEAFVSGVSSLKSMITLPDEAIQNARTPAMKAFANTYHRYQELLTSNNALDFDDLILKVVLLLENNADVRKYYTKKFRHVLIDEYQDVNEAQYRLTRALSDETTKLFMVGDDSQSIYGFRGSDITHIINARSEMGASVLKMEQNYRSTSNILSAANALIGKNSTHPDMNKKLWTDNSDGLPLVYYSAEDELDEATFVSTVIESTMKRQPGTKYSDFTVLYRANHQSRPLEVALVEKKIPYQVVGGLAFYQRKEIKDMIAYLRVIQNLDDSLALSRVINVPKRGIGDTTVKKFTDYASKNGISLYEAFNKNDEVEGISKGTAKKIQDFISMLDEFVAYSKSPAFTVTSLLDLIWHKTQYIEILKADGTEESLVRAENMQELYDIAISYHGRHEEPTMEGFLGTISLVSDQDEIEELTDSVKLMTVHTAKGLEFPIVFVVGLEEGIFPHARSLLSEAEIQEERRLCYVALTRAMNKLYLSSARLRSFMGATSEQKVSRFVKEIPKELVKYI